MEIRKTTLQDVDTVLDVFAAAKRYMRANGNASQWGDEYPDRSIVTYTHADNRPMQRLLEAYGFRRCGVIHGAFDGGERIAYDCISHI